MTPDTIMCGLWYHDIRFHVTVLSKCFGTKQKRKVLTCSSEEVEVGFLLPHVSLVRHVSCALELPSVVGSSSRPWTVSCRSDAQSSAVTTANPVISTPDRTRGTLQISKDLRCDPRSS